MKKKSRGPEAALLLASWILASMLLVNGWSACSETPGSSRGEICDNNRDDDGDGLTDCYDAECSCAPTDEGGHPGGYLPIDGSTAGDMGTSPNAEVDYGAVVEPVAEDPGNAGKARQVVTWAGTGAEGYQDGSGSQALFALPAGLAVDRTGNVYVSDYKNQRVRKVTLESVSTFAGSGAVGLSGGGFADGPVASAQFKLPLGLTIDEPSGRIFVGEWDNYRVRAIGGGPSNWTVSTLAGDGQNGYKNGSRDTAQFDVPWGLAAQSLGAGKVKIFVADAYNHCIRVIEEGSSGVNVRTFAGPAPGAGGAGYVDGPAAAARFYQPRGVAVDGSKVYVADTLNHRIRLIENGEVFTVAGEGPVGLTAGGFRDGPTAGPSGTCAAFFAPTGVAVDAAGDVYVADQQNHRIRKIVGGQVVTWAGSGATGPGKGGFADGDALTTARFTLPTAVAVDNAGNVYVTDRGNHAIRVVIP